MDEMVFVPIAEYMKLSRAARRGHLDLRTPCVEIGGGSKDFRALLAHHLGTMMPTKRAACLCHACHNDGCSNTDHLYWGTYSDNRIDLFETGWKYPARTLSEIHKRRIGINTRRALTGKPKSKAHRRNLSVAATRAWSIGRATECHSVDEGSIPSVRTNPGEIIL